MARRKKEPPIFIDRFSELDDLTPKQWRDPEAVLFCLGIAKRFSIFEATANQRNARMLTDLERQGRLKTEPMGFPWIRVVAIDGKTVNA